jgi:hypothetical protein
MTYNVDLQDLEPINILIHDGSVEYKDLIKLNPGEDMEFIIERRKFEDVLRKKVFRLINLTYYKGEKSLLRLKGIEKIDLLGKNENFETNHFIIRLDYKKETQTLALETAFGLTVAFTIGNNFHGELIDLKNSDFGSGTSFGKHGFTKQEWSDFLKSKNIL